VQLCAVPSTCAGWQVACGHDTVRSNLQPPSGSNNEQRSERRRQHPYPKRTLPECLTSAPCSQLKSPQCIKLHCAACVAVRTCASSKRARNGLGQHPKQSAHNRECCFASKQDFTAAPQNEHYLNACQALPHSQLKVPQSVTLKLCSLRLHRQLCKLASSMPAQIVLFSNPKTTS
jgi:hypothetical protein